LGASSSSCPSLDPRGGLCPVWHEMPPLAPTTASHFGRLFLASKYPRWIAGRERLVPPSRKRY
jgi:hypothetical protein